MEIVTEPRRCGEPKRDGSPCRIILRRPGRTRCGQHGGLSERVGRTPPDAALIAYARQILDARSARIDLTDPPALGPERSGGFVYFIGNPQDGPIKIGSSTNLVQRLHNLQASSPVPLELLASLQTDDRFGDERRCHRMFGDIRLHGEWFERDPALLDCIDRVNEGGRP